MLFWWCRRWNYWEVAVGSVGKDEQKRHPQSSSSIRSLISSPACTKQLRMEQNMKLWPEHSFHQDRCFWHSVAFLLCFPVAYFVPHRFSSDLSKNRFATIYNGWISMTYIWSLETDNLWQLERSAISTTSGCTFAPSVLLEPPWPSHCPETHR